MCRLLVHGFLTTGFLTSPFVPFATEHATRSPQFKHANRKSMHPWHWTRVLGRPRIVARASQQHGRFGRNWAPTLFRRRCEAEGLICAVWHIAARPQRQTSQAIQYDNLSSTAIPFCSSNGFLCVILKCVLVRSRQLPKRIRALSSLVGVPLVLFCCVTIACAQLSPLMNLPGVGYPSTYLPLADAPPRNLMGGATVAVTGSIPIQTASGKQAAYFSNSATNYLQFPSSNGASYNSITMCYWYAGS